MKGYGGRVSPSSQKETWTNVGESRAAQLEQSLRQNQLPPDWREIVLLSTCFSMHKCLKHLNEIREYFHLGDFVGVKCRKIAERIVDLFLRGGTGGQENDQGLTLHQDISDLEISLRGTAEGFNTSTGLIEVKERAKFMKDIYTLKGRGNMAVHEGHDMLMDDQDQRDAAIASLSVVSRGFGGLVSYVEHRIKKEEEIVATKLRLLKREGADRAVIGKIEKTVAEKEKEKQIMLEKPGFGSPELK